MTRAAFSMKLKPGFAVEYKRRHDEIWPELVRELKAPVSPIIPYTSTKRR